jgi:hypothetical protein
MLPPHLRPGIIYLITNKVNGKKYIGQTVHSASRRWGGHKLSANKGSRLPIHSAIRKYGPENFTVEVIAESLKPFLSDLERFFIKLHRSHHTQHDTTGRMGATDPAVVPITRGSVRSVTLSNVQRCLLRLRVRSTHLRYEQRCLQ